MHKHEKEITDRGEMEAILSRAEVAHIAMSDGDEPYVIPVNYGYRDGCLYFHCAQEGHKLEILRRNSRVCFEVSTDIEVHLGKSVGCGHTTHYKCVIGRGCAEILEDSEAKVEGLNALMAQYSDKEFVFPPKAVKNTAVVRITVESMTGKRSPAA
jgi:uncharacterized protein